MAVTRVVLLTLFVNLSLLLVLPIGGDAKFEEQTRVFNSLVDVAVKEHKWRARIKNALAQVELEGPEIDKLAASFKEMGLVRSKSRADRVGLGAAIFNVAQVLGFLGSFASGLKSVFSMFQENNASQSSNSNTQQSITTPSPYAEVNMCCPPCCISNRGEGKVVCLRTFCPILPTNKSVCADFPVCSWPCKLQVLEPLDDGLDDDFDERQERKFKSGKEFFHEVFKDYCKNATLCGQAVDVFNSISPELPEEVRNKLIDAMVYFKDIPHSAVRDRSTKRLTNSDLVKGLVGNLFRGAMRKQGMIGKDGKPKPKGNRRSSSNPTAEEREEFEKKHANMFRKPYCATCYGTCETNLKDCEIECENYRHCRRGKCVCT